MNGSGTTVNSKYLSIIKESKLNGDAELGGHLLSEELLQTIPQKIGKYTYYSIGSTTLNQLKTNGIIPKKNYGKLAKKKPDGLVLYHKSPKAVVEFKLPKNLRSEKDVSKAMKQQLEVAKALCKILIVSDGKTTYWVNALNGEFIKDKSGNPIITSFNPGIIKNTDTIEHLVEEIDSSITKTNSTVRSARLIDPTSLATRLWQTIWVATGKSPVKCLYNVVELFIFKFLSDLKVLADDIAFERVYEKAIIDPAEALEYYAANSRAKIYKLFPKSKDGTTIINGTIFVNEAGEPNLSQSILFQRSLEHLHKYEEEFGSLTKIDKQFKTRLFESFLNQEVEALGQYLTPRRVIQSIIRMGNLDEPTFQFRDKRICDPFCGVGGFPLEILNMNEVMKAHYKPNSDGIISVPFVLNGFDKGFEREDERTIILGKANMLIYLAELLFANPDCTLEFSRIFNETFHLFRDNLGTFGHIIEEESNKYDYILSNPPYVTSGSSIIKEEISKTPHTKDFYPVNALGLESISLEWMIKSLKKGGKAYIIIPDGILTRISINGKKLRDYILRECFLDAIISLPVRTFFANFKHTYILAITKKNSPEETQEEPVFTYLVSDIGERLTSVKREEIDENDLPEMEKFFRVFMATRSSSKDILEKVSPRCKIQDISLFQDSSHWVIDRWWTRDEKIGIGIEEATGTVAIPELNSVITELSKSLEKFDKISVSESKMQDSLKEIYLGDTSLFNLFIGKRVLKKDLPSLSGDIPLYSANVFSPFGFIKKSRIESFDYPSILWAIDGNFEFNLIQAGMPFETTDHCGTMQILNSKIVPEYLLFALNKTRIEESFDRSFRSSLTNMRDFAVKIPINKKGEFDIKLQKEIAALYSIQIEELKKLSSIKKILDSTFTRYIPQL
jgi:type I restriction-modification system DNA methylase subunit